MKFGELEKFCHENHLLIFTINDLKMLLSVYSFEYLRLKLSRWKEKKQIKTLKKGVYMLADYRPDEFEIAAKMVNPSYISLTTALSHYSFIPDISGEVTSITSKNTKTFIVEDNVYKYFHIKPSLFTDFVYLREGIFIATPEKTILDYFYFFNPKPDDLLFERLNKVKIKNLNWRRMTKLVGKFPLYVQKIFNHFKNAFTV